MRKHKEQRVGVFVDVQNMYYSAKNLYSTHVNFGKILEDSVSDRKLIRAIAYVIRADNTEEQKFFDALDNIGYEVRQKELQTFLSGTKKGDWDVGIAIDAITMAPKLDVVVLVTGDGDFVPLVEFLQYNGLLVEVTAFQETASSRLVQSTDDFTNLSENVNKYLLKKSLKGSLLKDK
ncbi:MAG: NYN domain-containing protein [Candidatus Jacksonbacteria bacterium]|jgi:uncharacterized LabA/DUF88 family protein|nr:NYN domain-containing protein [Candidatus Jacksonbacteria bacterium]MBT6034436.1 NYN domain-containing protein [Candidatus Jacksonbacteria bacterium]MBT6300925.1 NYN domain-containing protein [Candidatus Jacksonbacteria bacterium]MBT6757325.1 NYN domain-containing protein [Candidatus Jacksonbacteria bacterium]MBT6954907.1 NYN domain-containing protein [Candidatus Jacksonbacteria bacterium]